MRREALMKKMGFDEKNVHASDARAPMSYFFDFCSLINSTKRFFFFLLKLAFKIFLTCYF